jgi:hypothetical protein
MIGQFADRLVDDRPDLAQAILDREIGRLGDYITRENGRDCGCIIGTTAIAAGFRYLPHLDGPRSICDYVGWQLGVDPDWVDDVAMRIYELAVRWSHGRDWRASAETSPAAEKLVIHWLRTRIAIRLATRAGVTP